MKYFTTPSGSLYCQGTVDHADCAITTGEQALNVPNAMSCDSIRNSRVTAIGYLAAKDTQACWFTSQGYRDPNAPVVNYGEVAVLDSPVGNLNCTVAVNGVTCLTSGGESGFFASRSKFGIQTNGTMHIP
ncbi:MAG: hypothetical protein QM658_12770 [Gordonia sp. (in: high G+C Gram-positive bacteria)]